MTSWISIAWTCGQVAEVPESDAPRVECPVHGARCRLADLSAATVCIWCGRDDAARYEGSRCRTCGSPSPPVHGSDPRVPTDPEASSRRKP